MLIWGRRWRAVLFYLQNIVCWICCSEFWHVFVLYCSQVWEAASTGGWSSQVLCPGWLQARTGRPRCKVNWPTVRRISSTLPASTTLGRLSLHIFFSFSFSGQRVDGIHTQTVHIVILPQPSTFHLPFKEEVVEYMAASGVLQLTCFRPRPIKGNAGPKEKRKGSLSETLMKLAAEPLPFEGMWRCFCFLGLFFFNHLYRLLINHALKIVFSVLESTFICDQWTWLPLSLRFNEDWNHSQNCSSGHCCTCHVENS